MTMLETVRLERQPAFAIAQRTGAISITDIVAVLKGEVTGLHVKEGFNPQVAAALTDNFFGNPGLKERRDGVPGQYIGASHYRMNAARYFRECADARPAIEALLGTMVDPVRALFDALKRELARDGIALRLARSEHGEANVCRATCWSGAGTYVLEPHDDVAQVLFAGDDFELTEVAQNTVVALNFYPNTAEEGGNLRVWDCKPTADDRRRYDVETTGYPYPQAALAGACYHDFMLQAGDIVLIDGGYVHGVTKQSGNGKPRLLVHAFLGFARPDLVLWWT
ncbi:hypothetical protein [Phreatobacter sp. AB_2022a]|uniref:hypothetical protein n=1 Tax=Phreatobacter sp. AB_2022a TaxID=3003134 RepID=UPI0022876EB4|nr:hypothetical protein [Phreatobacter sp. AB_2022a]MCZ0736884.1 hypothetical protein [Phreatobacter sp. AB_2022a]